GPSGGCGGPGAAQRPRRAPSPPRTSTATGPRPPSPAPWVPPSTTTEPPCGPTPWPRPTACAAGTSPLWSSGGGGARSRGGGWAEPAPAWVPDVRVERIPEASHWVQADAPERVNQLMVDFL